MGENKNYKELDVFAKKFIKKIEAPTLEKRVSEAIMQQILQTKMHKTIKSESLISLKSWIFIAASFIVILVVPYFLKDTSYVILSDEVNFLQNLNFSKFLNQFKVSPTVLYSVILFGVMIFIQIVYLKNYFEKRIN